MVVCVSVSTCFYGCVKGIETLCALSMWKGGGGTASVFLHVYNEQRYPERALPDREESGGLRDNAISS